MAVIAARLREAHAVNRNVDIRIVPLFDDVVGSPTRRGMWLGFAAVLCLLVIACANVGGVLSARAARRRRELAVRSALGAGRARLVRQLLAEGISLWVVASVAGVLLAYGLIRLLLAYAPRALPRMEDVGLDVAGAGRCVSRRARRCYRLRNIPCARRLRRRIRQRRLAVGTSRVFPGAACRTCSSPARSPGR